MDACIEAGFYQLWQKCCRGWSAYSTALDRWRIRGLRRIIVDILGDGVTALTVALILIFYFALPAIEESDEIWNKGRQYSIVFTDKNGTFVGRRGILQNDAIPLDEIPQTLINAVLATEDTRFFDHWGIDPGGITRAFIANLRANEVVQGGSTITQQLAKNLFLSPEKSLKRKVSEAFFALWIEARLSKREILKLYLDRAYLGGGAYGVEAASQFYFGKSVRDITLYESAMLAGLFKAPSKYAPHLNIERSRARANVVLDRMISAGMATEGEVYAARQKPANIVTVASAGAPSYYLDWAFEQAEKVLKQQNLEKEYVINVRTTLDLDMQKKAQDTISAMVNLNGRVRKFDQAALVSMSTDGAVRAIVGGRDYEASQFNRATKALRQPGSSFKPIVYLAALRSGFKPSSVLVDRPINIGGWQPKNYGKSYSGRVTLQNALRRSINTIPVQIAQLIGRKNIIETARLLGLKSKLISTPSLPLGTSEVTVLDLTGVYATLANGGREATPYAVLEISRPDGTLLYTRKKDQQPAAQVLEAEKVEDLNYMLNQVVEAGTGRRARLSFADVSGKTGTTQAYRDAWFLGYTSKLVTGVWFGNDDYSSMNRVTGGSLPAQTWREFMIQAQSDEPPGLIPGVATKIRTPELKSLDTAPLVVSSTRSIVSAGKVEPGTRVYMGMAQLFRQIEVSIEEENLTPTAPAPTTVKTAQHGWSTRQPTFTFSTKTFMLN
jgi:penicillin-binding protein 1A